MYSIVLDNGDVTATATRKDRSIKAGDALGVSYTVLSKTGKVVHSHEVQAQPQPTVKVCKKDPSHGEHRVTKSGSYCYACDRIVAERQKAERAAARALVKGVEQHVAANA